jgi:hypothetical protein
MEYHVLCLAIVDEQMHVPPRWLFAAELIVTAYHRTWVVFNTNRAISAFAPPTILTSSMVQLIVPELWSELLQLTGAGVPSRRVGAGSNRE